MQDEDSKRFPSVAHFRAGRVRPLGDQFEPNSGTAVRAFRSYGFFVEQFEFLGLEPHELKALGAATDLRCHDVPRTLRMSLVTVTGR